ncbi:YciI family protein [Allopusillimonas soli]|uniref:YciI family protein n=1 Tax=Allopusillimonas soli TaxID=659016 RepID=A0A853FCH5_9BURK|nr:YciI family protein [Allopusillimonas soli]NYT37783.1 YciI family protein [Allopusillimonas soli]TEA73697.1 YciI family protein [Allopusillimonas soli]
MPYLIETFDKPDSRELRLAVRDKHLQFLETNKKLLLACGAKLDDEGVDASGGIYILDVDSRAEAEDFINADPFTEAQLFQRIDITRWRKAYFDGENCL